MKLTNVQMSNYLDALQAIAGKATGKLGYAVSRNMRKLANENVEFMQIKNELINKYGTEYVDESGECQISIKVGTDGYSKFMEEIKEYCEITHDVDIYMIDETELYSSTLNANEMMSIDFMVEENCDK